MKEPRFGQALPNHMRECQRTVGFDRQWRHIPLVIDRRHERLPSVTDALLYAASAIALMVFCFNLLGQ